VQHVGEIVGHVGALKGVGRHRAEIDRLAGWAVLAGEFWVGDVGIGRGRRDRCHIALAEDRGHCLAGPAVLRPHCGDDVRVRDHLAGVGRGLRRIVLPGGGSTVVEHHHVDLVAGNAALGIGVVGRDHRALLHEGRLFRIGSGQRNVDADRDALVGGKDRPRPQREAPSNGGSRQLGDKRAAGCHAPCLHREADAKPTNVCRFSAGKFCTRPDGAASLSPCRGSDEWRVPTWPCHFLAVAG